MTNTSLFTFAFDHEHNNNGIVYRIADPRFNLYIGNNFLNAYFNAFPVLLEFNKSHSISVIETEIEKKLSEPYNTCTERRIV